MNDSETLIVAIERSKGGNKYRQYHVRGRICDSGMEVFEFPLEMFLLKDSNVGFRGHELVKKLNDIEGLDEVYLKPFCLTVKKSLVFSWEELEADILFALESVFGKPVEIKAS